MSRVSKCDNCDSFDKLENPLTPMQGGRNNPVYLKGEDIQIVIEIPWRKEVGKDGHLCENCRRAIVSSRFADLCGLLAPYQPARTAGLIQGKIEPAPPRQIEITSQDIELLRRLRGLLPTAE